MKKLLTILLALIMCFGFTITAFAEEGEDMSRPRLMVTSYKVDTGSITTSGKSKLEITFKNYSKTKALKNIKLVATDESGELAIDGTGTAYVDKINADGTYVWKLSLSATDSAQSGNHKLSITSDFEDSMGEQYNSNDVITLNVKGKAQPTEPDATQPRLMVTAYNLSNKNITSSKKTKLSITVKNFSKTKAVNNVRLSLSDESGEVKPSGKGAVIVDKISAGGTYVWTVNLTATKTAQSGVHRLSLTADYEDSNSNVFSSNDIISVNVKGVEADKEETTQNTSQARLMVTDYSIDGGYIKPSKTAKLSIKLKNFNKSKAVSNLKITILDESGEIKVDGMPTVYVDKIKAGGTYTWDMYVKAISTAQIGEHKLNLSYEYEDSNFQSYSGTDVVIVNVKQSVALDYSGLELSAKVIQGDTETVAVTLMNTGKTKLSNCKIDFDVKGLEGGGTLFIGEIPAGESKDGSANLRVSNELLGDTTGTATLSYEDEYGKEYSQTVELSTNIIERVEYTEQEEEKQSKYPLWWLFLILGLAVGGGVGCAIPISINNAKKRKEDELRL